MGLGSLPGAHGLDLGTDARSRDLPFAPSLNFQGEAEGGALLPVLNLGQPTFAGRAKAERNCALLQGYA